ncbi:MAG: OmpA family protein [Ferruginibacter sp.]
MRSLILLSLLSAHFVTTGQTIDKAYSNYDFVAGEKTIFEDHNPADLKDKTHTQWIIKEGQASTIEFDGEKCISIDAYYTKLAPVLFSLKQLPDSTSIEYDTWLDAGYDGNPGIEIHLMNGDNEEVITPNKHSLSVAYPGDGRESKDNPEEYFGENKFYNRWVHISIAQLASHLTVYLDQYKMIDITDSRIKPNSIVVSGNSSQNMKILLKNFRVATGFPGKLIFDHNKFITHAIKFDVNKHELKPESITLIKQVYQYLQQNPGDKLEIGGHTDSDGTAGYNTTLSQLRAEAVKAQLVSMGIDKERLQAKGYGQSKPIDDKNTVAAKAMNRRVEFTKL